MFKAKINSLYIRQFIYMIIVILPSLLTGNIYQALYHQADIENKLSALNAIGSSVHLNLKNGQDHLSYSLHTLTSNPNFKTLDPLYLAVQLRDFVYFNKEVSNAYVLDPNGNLIYGINDTQFLNLGDTPHITQALNGHFSYYTTFINQQALLQMAQPIFSTPPDSSLIGVLVISIDFKALEESLNAIRDDAYGTNAYLITTEGTVLVSSSSSVIKRTIARVDIDYLKTQLSYNPTSSFISPHGIESHGIFFEIQPSDWTLLVTSGTSNSFDFMDIISFLLGALGAGGITTTEAIRRRCKKNTPNPIDIQYDCLKE